MASDQLYFASRAAAEREAALQCANESARKSHLERAARYDELASSIAAHSTKLGLTDKWASIG
jgi:hypothetical protein